LWFSKEKVDIFTAHRSTIPSNIYSFGSIKSRFRGSLCIGKGLRDGDTAVSFIYEL
jgi:hypothetical protein